MKPSSLAPALLAATLFLIPVLHAETVNATTEAADKRAQHQAEILKRFDKNGDGKLDADEKAAAKEFNRENGSSRQIEKRERAARRFKEKFDKDGDGKLNDTERAAAVKAFETNPRLVKRFDKDGDGKLNDAEKAAAREAFIEKRAGKSE